MEFLKNKRRFAMAAAFVTLLAGGQAQAAGGEIDIPSQSWSFAGIFGSFDKASLQRGFQVYREVCSACHGLDYIAFRNLQDLGYSEDDVKALAAEYEIEDGPNDEGEMFMRPAIPADRFPNPYANDEEAKVANGGSLPPDLSLIVDARAHNENYVYALLVGFEEQIPTDMHLPEDFELPDGKYFNRYFAGHAIAMPPQLFEDQVEYADGTPATTEQMAKDVVNFLAWASEPNLEERKRMGVKVILFLVAFTLLFYAIKRKVWSDVH